MTEEQNIESLIASINLNQVLVALLDEHGSLKVPTLKFLNHNEKEKELIIDYDDSEKTFTFSLRNKNDEN